EPTVVLEHLRSGHALPFPDIRRIGPEDRMIGSTGPGHAVGAFGIPQRVRFEPATTGVPNPVHLPPLIPEHRGAHQGLLLPGCGRLQHGSIAPLPVIPVRTRGVPDSRGAVFVRRGLEIDVSPRGRGKLTPRRLT